MRAQKVLNRARRANLDADTPPELHHGAEENTAQETSSQIGQDLLAVVRRAHAADVDAEAALRTAVRELEENLRAQARNHGPRPWIAPRPRSGQANRPQNQPAQLSSHHKVDSIEADRAREALDPRG